MASRDLMEPMESPLESTAASGDVLLVIGSARKPIRVHSLILRTASAVFNAMLGPHYTEGRDLSSESPKEIPLPEDDPEALNIIFNTIHYRLDAVEDPLDTSLVLRVAIMADKYGLVQALKLVFRDWLRCENVKDAKKLWQLAIASAWLKNEKCFEESTRALLYHHAGSYIGLGETDMMPPDIVGLFEGRMGERREQLRLDLLSRILQLGVPGATYECSKCHYGKIRGMDYFMGVFGRFEQVSYNPERWSASFLDPCKISQISISGVIESIDMRCMNATEVKCKDGRHLEPSFERHVREVTDKFIADLRGVTLAYVRTGEISRARKRRNR